MMKRRITAMALVLSMMIGCMTACGGRKTIEEKPDITTIRSICEMATLEWYYHNVATSEKDRSKGFFHLRVQDRTSWI